MKLPTQKQCIEYAKTLTLEINEAKEFDGMKLPEEWIIYAHDILKIIKFAQNNENNRKNKSRRKTLQD